jgi:hypothetical protein
MDLWIVGKNIVESRKGIVWEFSGVFDSEEKAVNACINSKYFYGPVKLNEILPDESKAWDGCIYPCKKK